LRVIASYPTSDGAMHNIGSIDISKLTNIDLIPLLCEPEPEIQVNLLEDLVINQDEQFSEDE
jgi:hypothetical protein